jgi:hypothetical protein
MCAVVYAGMQKVEAAIVVVMAQIMEEITFNVIHRFLHIE